jgi:hypothetical protein
VVAQAVRVVQVVDQVVRAVDQAVAVAVQADQVARVAQVPVQAVEGNLPHA